MNKCDHIVAIDEQIPIIKLSDNFIWNHDPGYFCKFCPECGDKLKEPE